MPRLPKSPAMRQRRNRAVTAATLTQSVAGRKAPPLPALVDMDGRKHTWHPQAMAFWRLVWRSEMAPEYVDADIAQLQMLVRLVDAFWTAESARVALEYASEIRLQSRRFGLSPLDRRSLDWVRGEDEPARGTTPEIVEEPRDPREYLRALS